LFSLFPLVPVNVTGEDVDGLSRQFWLTPIVGAFNGAIAGAVFYFGHAHVGALTSAALAVLAVHCVNRFLHFDGLIDLGDGLIATGAHEKRVAALKDTHVGAGGVSFGIMFTILIISALASTVPTIGFAYLLVPFAAEVAAKNGLVAVASLGTAKEGLGSPFISNSNAATLALSTALSLAIALALALATSWGDPWRPALMVAAMMAASVAAAAVLKAIAERAFGRVNGDVLGATNELAKAASLVVALVVLTW